MRQLLAWNKLRISTACKTNLDDYAIVYTLTTTLNPDLTLDTRNRLLTVIKQAINSIAITDLGMGANMIYILIHKADLDMFKSIAYNAELMVELNDERAKHHV